MQLYAGATWTGPSTGDIRVSGTTMGMNGWADICKEWQRGCTFPRRSVGTRDSAFSNLKISNRRDKGEIPLSSTANIIAINQSEYLVIFTISLAFLKTIIQTN